MLYGLVMHLMLISGVRNMKFHEDKTDIYPIKRILGCIFSETKKGIGILLKIE